MTFPTCSSLVGVVFLIVLVLTKNASAQSESLYRQLSVTATDFSIVRGQTSPKLTFQHTAPSCSPSPLLSVSSTESGLRGASGSWTSCFKEPARVFDRFRVPSEPRLQGGLFERTFRYGGRQVWSDYRNLYSRDSALNFGVALAGGAILANTAMDRHFAEWYQDDVRSSGTDDFAKFWKQFGEGATLVPIFAVTAIGYRFYEQSDWNKRRERCLFGEYTVRTARGYLVGFPTLLIFQSVLGAERPSQGNEKGSNWRPFHEDHGVSGHAFIGAMPFITAAQMVEKPWLKGVFYACSVLPAWSRVNDNAHYLSQAILGWYLAYLSARAVSQTDGAKLPRGLTIFPITEGNYVGLGFLYKR